MHSTKILIISLIVLVAQQFVSPLVMASMMQQFAVTPTLESDHRMNPNQADRLLAEESSEHRHGVDPSTSKAVVTNSDIFNFENIDSASSELQEKHLQHASASMADCCDTTCICCGGDCQPVVGIQSARLSTSFNFASLTRQSSLLPAKPNQSPFRPPIL